MSKIANLLSKKKAVDVSESLSPGKQQFLSSTNKDRNWIMEHLNEINRVEAALCAPTEKERLGQQLDHLKNSFKDQFGISVEEYHNL